MQLDLLIRTKEFFATLERGKARAIFTNDDGYEAWAIKFMDGTYGVGIPYSANTIINERFANVRLYSDTVYINKEQRKFLLLTSSIESLRNEFAAIASQFIETGEEHKNRKDIINDPFDWWDKWRNLLGNAVREKKVYSLLGEMKALEMLLKNGENVDWTPTDFATHDIETNSKAYEIKSTTSRYDQKITISSQFQGQSEKELSIIFCRFEKSNLGFSIDDMVSRLSDLGMDKTLLNIEIDKMGYETGSKSRIEKYKLHEMRDYTVDASFPVIALNSYVAEHYSNNIMKLTYEIDLTGLPFKFIETT
ncbi:PD-(D/E)XK motif protein [Evansella sp. LMS18]|uniref:PD-(D/E)XK motif protein n=1 Tax=Evansella sp. LMS18 TaxID=2924033 RepID=UPI0020D152BC|nr:PD-(D/E)XK motif protein [Evansella sp. LMS18]UTR10190.1 PD-(D/E)XK motif protein [Evansella sp. LMS18]